MKFKVGDKIEIGTVDMLGKARGLKDKMTGIIVWEYKEGDFLIDIEGFTNGHDGGSSLYGIPENLTTTPTSGWVINKTFNPKKVEE